MRKTITIIIKIKYVFIENVSTITHNCTLFRHDTWKTYFTIFTVWKITIAVTNLRNCIVK